jgi:acetyl esterase/lipase
VILFGIADWDDAYANGPNIAGGARWPEAWVAPAAAFRTALAAEGRARLDIAYGAGARQRFDLFLPQTGPRGLVVYVHGGFWMRLDRSFWSHLAGGPLEAGYAVAVPGYTLCPEASVPAITLEIARAIEAAAGLVAGPIRLVGHSAGGQLVTRMISTTSPLDTTVRERIALTVSLSGLHDLRPLLNTAMNATLQLDAGTAAAESPALLAPVAGARLVCWVGAAERSEFLRQSALLANVWRGLGAVTAAIEEPDRHHFDVIEGLRDARHPLCRALTEG